MAENLIPSTIDGYVRIVRTAMDAVKLPLEPAVQQFVPPELQEQVRQHLELERRLRFTDANMVEDHDREHVVWLPYVDRARWYYWTRMRNHLIDQKGWSEAAVNSIDEATDKILGAMENPMGDLDFNTRGLVVGYVQSGKTANYSALIAKAADAGYRLIIVLTGIHNTLRRQTQIRLAAELIGVNAAGEPVGVGRPTPEREWSTFTTEDINFGDFNPGHGTTTALVASNPILIVTKKNYTVLQRLIRWIDLAQQEVRDRIPCLVIDDEADQASPNTGGNRSPADTRGEINEQTEEDDSPSKINLQIRQILRRFKRVGYVAYTATPFANVLIDPDTEDVEGWQDLYPRSFVVSLPRPEGYYGAEQIFGTGNDGNDGMDVIRYIPDDEAPLLAPRRRVDIASFHPQIPPSLRHALYDFVLAGATRARRGDGRKPATMLIHPTQWTPVQLAITPLVDQLVSELKFAWRYSRDKGIQQRLQERWEEDFRRVTRGLQEELDVPFSEIADHIGPFLEQVEVKQLNYGSDDELDYEKDPELKVVVIGGNKLSRGLTLEGLLVSYYVRAANAYDTLMQMGRWFGYRPRYADLTRIYTTKQLASWFRDLAVVEQEIRAEIARYELERKTPMQLGVKIRMHPAMMVTSPLKMKAADVIRISYENQFPQTVTFPFEPPDLDFFGHNLSVARQFVASLGGPTLDGPRPVWASVPAVKIMEFLDQYRMDAGNSTVRADLLRDYIRRQNGFHELTHFTVGVVGQEREKPELGSIDLGVTGGRAINLIERSRLIRHPNSVKAIASQDDQKLGLTAAQIQQAVAWGVSDGSGYRKIRGQKEGLLLIYPISRNSGYEYRSRARTEKDTRQALFSDPDHGEHVIGIALSFPPSDSGATAEYVAIPIGANEE